MAARGESTISGPMASKIVQFFSGKEMISTSSSNVKACEVLTRREKEILQQVIKGLTNREIAAVLYISENTVKNHLRNIMEKLHMNNRAQVAAYALTEGWLNQD
jgi:two-component system NarL family response regulator